MEPHLRLCYRLYGRTFDQPGRGRCISISSNVVPNANCKKVRGSHVLLVSCAYCKTYIAHYQKVGESNFVKMYNERIIAGAVDFSLYHGAIFCPGCNERIATRYITKIDKKEAYRLVPSAFNKKKVQL